MTGKDTTIACAVIGAGGMGARWAHALAKCDQVTIRTICDRDEAKAKEVAATITNCTTATEWNEIAQDASIDAVIVALPHNLLFEASLAFLQSHKHVLCEKPGALHSEQIARLTALAKEKDLRYMVCYNHRFHDAFLRMQKMFAQGIVGKPLFIRSKYGFGGRPGYDKEWRLNPDISGGGELIDQGVHMIDLAQVFLGHCTSVSGVTSHFFWDSQGEDNAFVLLKNTGGNVASIHVSLTNWKPEHCFELYGTKGYLVVEGLGKKYGGKEVLKVGIRDDTSWSVLNEEVFECDNNAEMSLVRALEHFVGSIVANENLVSDGDNAESVLKIIEEIYAQNA